MANATKVTKGYYISWSGICFDAECYGTLPGGRLEVVITTGNGTRRAIKCDPWWFSTDKRALIRDFDVRNGVRA